MMAVNDNMFKALQDAGYTGALSDMLYQWLGTFSNNPDQSINDLWREALINLSGLPEEDFQFNDYYSAYLTGRGYAGAFSDQLNSFWEDVANGVIDLPTGSGGLFDGNYADYPLVNNGDNTVAAGSVLNLNPNSQSVDLTTGTVTVPPYTPAIFPNHDVDGASFGGLLSQVDNEDIIPTSNVFVDDKCFSSDRTTGAFVNGIARTSDSSFQIHMNSGGTTPSDADGKYLNLMSAFATSAVLRNNPEFTITTVSNTNQFAVSHNNRTEQELIDLFGNDGSSTNFYSIAFQASGYTLLGAVNLANAVDRVPVTETGSSLSPTAIASGVVISENTAAIDGNYTELDNLVGGLIADKDILQGDYLTVEFDADIVQGSLLAQVGGVQEPVTQGTNKFVLKGAGGTAPIGVELPIIVAAETGDIEATCSNIKFTVTRWLHWPTDDFTLNIKVTPTESDTGTTGQPALFGVSAGSDDGIYFQYDSGTTSYQLIQYQGGAPTAALWQKVMAPIPSGQTTEISIDFSSSSDTVIRFDGVVVAPDQAQSISGTYSWGNTFAIGYNLDASNSYYDGVYAALKVKDTVIAP